MRHRHHFNLIELLLSMAAIAIGVTAIMALFAIGANSTRDSIARNEAAYSADLYANYYSIMVNKSQADWDNWTATLPAAHPGAPDSPAWTADADVENIFYANSYTWAMCGGMDSPYATPTASGADFAALVLVWQKPLQTWAYNNATSNFQEYNMPTSVGFGLCVEISWPLLLPYARRQKAVFYSEIYRSK